MSVVRASVVAAHGLSVNVPLAGRLTPPLWFLVVLNVMWIVAATSIPRVSLHQGSAMNARIGLQGPTVSTAVQEALVQLWLVVEAVCHASVTAMATRSEDTVTTRRASATAHTTLRDHTVSPAYLATTETPGAMVHATASARAVLCCSPPPPPLPCLSPLLWGGEVAQRETEDFLIACGFFQ